MIVKITSGAPYEILNEPVRIVEIERVIVDIGIEIDPSPIPAWVRLHEPPEQGGVLPGTIIIESVEFRIEALGGIAEGNRRAGVRTVRQIANLANAFVDESWVATIEP